MDVSAIASQMIAASQFKTQEIKMNADAQQAVADMILQNARQIQALSESSGNQVNLFV